MSNEKNVFAATTSDPDFIAYYTKTLLPQVNVFEAKRQALIHPQMFMYKGIYAAVGAFLLASYIVENDTADTLLLLFGFVMLIGSGVSCLFIYSYKKEVKASIYPAIFGYYGDAVKYYPSGTPAITDTRFEKLFPFLDTPKSKCYLQVIYKGVKFEILEGFHTTDKGEDKSLYLCISMNKSITGTTVIFDDMGKILNKVMKAGLEKNIAHCENVQLESSLFENRFELYSTNQVEARRLITPAVMERLLSIKLLFGESILGAFYRGNFLLLLVKGNWLPQPPYTAPVTFLPESAAIMSLMKEITNLIDALNLDKKTGL